MIIKLNRESSIWRGNTEFGAVTLCSEVLEQIEPDLKTYDKAILSIRTTGRTGYKKVVLIKNGFWTWRIDGIENDLPYFGFFNEIITKILKFLFPHCDVYFDSVEIWIKLTPKDD